ncbi:isocitrate lyase/phosphoenolpyruvate mutase family protein [Rhizobium sp. 1AS11]|uniref:isocitrate lyase/phosphoenolpyruvate mutase family protein n=1 Tax=Rhizobium acaciae TaxID=2989736 RepID=UPI002223BAEA|nr:isocitrate lyase/phosphoenolpyruvate mutase family protein [Rhizobium acaciae]MCW1413003.1 isocitrate lyase/phosphoenolpyruvate mutase family protein [Rhizobium acaciae]MCW1745155.1 isocitrate lyase/phosphoenolpyruvate mutase family protein [Rhizobium acaciae]
MDQTVVVPKSIGPIEDPTKTLRNLISSSDLTYLMGAHDGLSAAIAKQGGFKGLWASGLSISASLGYRNANEADWTRVLDVVECMADVSRLPILVDSDYGFGNLSARSLAAKLLQRGASGVCIGDAKMNAVSNRHALAGIDEFSGRLKAIKDTARSDLVVVARTMALTGHGLDEALLRAHAYVHAGADAILIHSPKADAGEISAFGKKWKRLPLMIVVTNDCHTPVSVFSEAGISMLIWADHAMQASVAGMRAVCDCVTPKQACASIEPEEVAIIDEMLDLGRYDEPPSGEDWCLPGVHGGHRPR